MNALYTSRRGFLLGTASLATALTLGVSHQAHAATQTFVPNVFVRLEPDGTLFLTCNRSEMGQGVRSSIPVLLADEMGADLARVSVVQATGDAVYGDQNTANYGADIVLPGMVTAVIARPPHLGGQVSQYDDTATRLVPGVIDVIEMPRWSAPGRFHPLGGVAVVAENTWAAIQGRKVLRISWEDGPHAGIDSSEEYTAMRAAVNTSGKKRRSVGNADDALEASSNTVSATYLVPHLMHAPL